MNRIGEIASSVRASVRMSRRLSLFSLISALPIVTPLMVPPIVTRTYGADGWTAIAIGQSAGAVFGIAIALSWPLYGSSRVAGHAASVQKSLYRASLETRLACFVALAPVSTAIAYFLAATHPGVSALTSLAFTANGFTAAWFFAGTGNALALLLLEALPRALATILSAILIALGWPLATYPVALLVSLLFTFIATSLHVVGNIRIRLRVATWHQIRSEVRLTSGRIVNGIYFEGATSIVTLVAPSATFVFASYDRLVKAIFNACLAVPQTLISWVGRAEAKEPRKVVIALFIDTLLSVMVGIVTWITLPLLIDYLYSGLFEVSDWARAVVALSTAATLLGRSLLLNGILPLGAHRFASNALIACSSAGVLLVLGGAVWAGSDGALTAALCTEAIAIVVSVAGLRRSLRAEREDVPR